MLICGIHDGHNGAAALSEDGRLIAALQEERPTRIKNWHGFPTRAISVLLESGGWSWTDVDAYVFSSNEYFFPPGNGPHDREAQVHAYKRNCSLAADIRRRLRHTPIRALVHRHRKSGRLAPLLERGVPLERISFIEHHRCHATAAYYGPGASRDALVVTLDGAGDGLCATVSVPDETGRPKRLAAVEEEHSIGILWALITALMGMVPNEHEYKMMGMAPYAAGSRVRALADRFARDYRLTEGRWERSNGLPEASYAYDYWRDSLEFARFDQVCSGLQLFTEEFVATWVRDWLRRTGRRKLRLSGGVFMNVKLNKVLGELEEVEDLYVFPSCGDETNAIGACWAYLEDKGWAERIEPLGPFTLGVAHPEGAFDAAARAAHEKGFAVEVPADLAHGIASLLAQGVVVARCEGREEFGARALGNRSILADPSRRELVRVINRAIKSRDFWMPFACSVLAETQERYLKNPKGFAAPYMILTFDSKETDQIIAGCHPEDGTIRPQVVHRDWSPGYHRILEHFFEMTGRGAILNTSFNLHGEPIASHPADALDVMERSGLTHLALGKYLITKNEPRRAS